MKTIEDFFFFFSECGLTSDKSSLYYKAVLAHLLVVVPLAEIGMTAIEDRAKYVRCTIDIPFVNIVDDLYQNKEVQSFLKEYAIQTSNLIMTVGDLSTYEEDEFWDGTPDE